MDDAVCAVDDAVFAVDGAVAVAVVDYVFSDVLCNCNVFRFAHFVCNHLHHFK